MVCLPHHIGVHHGAGLLRRRNLRHRSGGESLRPRLPRSAGRRQTPQVQRPHDDGRDHHLPVSPARLLLRDPQDFRQPGHLPPDRPLLIAPPPMASPGLPLARKAPPENAPPVFPTLEKPQNARSPARHAAKAKFFRCRPPRLLLDVSLRDEHPTTKGFP